MTESQPQSWCDALLSLKQPCIRHMLLLGFSAGVPLLLIFSSLSLWLTEAGVDKAAVTFFSWAALGYSFKFIWAPLIDKIPLPWLTAILGRRRSWLLVAQLFVMTAIAMMASIDPASGTVALEMMALAAVMLGFSAATQDIVIDAYRIEIVEPRYQAMMSATYIAGYRIGMIVTGAGALYLAEAFGSTRDVYSYIAWSQTYLLMAATMLIGIITTLIIPEPSQHHLRSQNYVALDYLRLLFVFLCAVSVFAGSFFYSADLFAQIAGALGNDPIIRFVIEALRFILAISLSVFTGWLLIKSHIVNREMARETWFDPVIDFFTRYGSKSALYILLLVGLYRIADIVPGVISNVFYQDLGFSKTEIAAAVKTFGVVVSVVGGFMGGLFATRYGVLRTLMLGAILAAFTNLVFVWLAMTGYDITVLYAAVTVDNLAAGFASAAFVAFLSSLTSVTFTAVQYAIFSSLMTLLPKTIGGYSGTIVNNIGYPSFFMIVMLMGIPVLWLVWRVSAMMRRG